MTDTTKTKATTTLTPYFVSKNWVQGRYTEAGLAHSHLSLFTTHKITD